MNNDLISRSALKKAIENLIGYSLSYEAILNAIDNAPTVEIDLVKVVEEHEKIGFKKGFNDGYAQAQVDLERPQGEWITVKQDTVLGSFEVKNKVCDQCNHATKYEYPFCPWCGAKMKGGAE